MMPFVCMSFFLYASVVILVECICFVVFNIQRYLDHILILVLRLLIESHLAYWANVWTIKLRNIFDHVFHLYASLLLHIHYVQVIELYILTCVTLASLLDMMICMLMAYDPNFRPMIVIMPCSSFDILCYGIFAIQGVLTYAIQVIDYQNFVWTSISQLINYEFGLLNVK